ncbi:C6 transcription factor protein [Fusarium bulbicola]|nr:C6 transcription factor protein [Fusarium bulbicola]
METSPLLAESNTDEVKRVRDEAKSTLQQKYPTLVDMAAMNILKVFGAMREARLEIAELCISISFPLVILQCRSLTNLLASLSAFDDYGKVPERTWHSRNLSMLGNLENGFGYRWEYEWRLVFDRWRNQAKDHQWLNDKIGDLKGNVAHIRPIFLSIKEAFVQIDRMAGTSLVDLLSDIQDAFDMFERKLAECAVKADELRVEQERPKHLSPFVNSFSAQSWSSGSNIPSGGITQRTSFGRDGNNATVHVGNSSTKTKERRLTKLRQRFSINPDARENHWTSLFGLAKSPVVVILTAAMPLTICSTILCGPPDAVPAKDSNFFSTLSQFISSLAGLYVIVKPLFSRNKKDKIKTSFPKTFYTMLALSLLTSLTSAVIYAWSPAASIPLAYVSGLTLNIATLLIIQDSGNQIKESNRYNEDLVFAVNELEMELAENRAERSNEASLGMIVNILRRIEGKIDDSKLDSNPTENHRSIAAALRPFNPRSPANSSEVLGVPSFLRQETIDSPAAPTDPNPAISFSAHQVLFWPAIQSALPESVKLMCQMQGGTYSTRLEASRPKLPHATSVDISSDWLSKLTNPILDQKTYFQRTLGVAIDGNFGICIESCIVLVVMALGSMGQKALQEAGFAGTPASSPYVGRDAEMPGLDFFNEARKRFGFLMCEQGLQACQFYLLSGLFYAEALRPIDWWAMLSKASACSAYFWNNVSRDRDEWMLDMQSRLFWITSMFEAVLSQELNLPPSNSLHLEEHIALPKFISAQDIASFGSFRYPGDDPFFHYHFLSQLAHRLILTRARNSLFHFNATADYPPEPVEDELIRQLEQWRERLPPMLQFDPKSPLTQADSPSDALVTAWLHARYFVARYHIGRPLLHRALERPASLTEGHLRKCRDAISAVLAWASVIQVTDTMRSCNPLKFFVCSQ